MALIAGFALPAAALAEPGMTVEIVPLPATVTGVEATSRGSFDGARAYVFTEDGPLLAAPCPDEPNGWCVDATQPTPTFAAPSAEMAGALSSVLAQAGTLPDGRLAAAPFGERTAYAWFTQPTTRYAHGVLGDAVEAGALVCGFSAPGRDVISGTHHVYLDDGSVFEDIGPRVVDLESDGSPEIVAVRSSPEVGASLTVYDVELRSRDKPVLDDIPGVTPITTEFVCPLIARTPPIGTPNRWLNPAAIHDFDGDGVLDVALVETPHIGGELQLWSGASLLADEPEMRAARRGFFNHAVGSRALDLAEVVRIGGRDALVLPNATREALVAVRYGDGEWTEIATAPLPARALSGIAAVGRDLAVGLEDGTLARVVLTD